MSPSLMSPRAKRPVLGSRFRSRRAMASTRSSRIWSFRIFCCSLLFSFLRSGSFLIVSSMISVSASLMRWITRTRESPRTGANEPRMPVSYAPDALQPLRGRTLLTFRMGGWPAVWMSTAVFSLFVVSGDTRATCTPSSDLTSAVRLSSMSKRASAVTSAESTRVHSPRLPLMAVYDGTLVMNLWAAVRSCLLTAACGSTMSTPRSTARVSTASSSARPEGSGTMESRSSTRRSPSTRSVVLPCVASSIFTRTRMPEDDVILWYMPGFWPWYTAV